MKLFPSAVNALTTIFASLLRPFSDQALRGSPFALVLSSSVVFGSCSRFRMKSGLFLPKLSFSPAHNTFAATPQKPHLWRKAATLSMPPLERPHLGASPGLEVFDDRLLSRSRSVDKAPMSYQFRRVLANHEFLLCNNGRCRTRNLVLPSRCDNFAFSPSERLFCICAELIHGS